METQVIVALSAGAGGLLAVIGFLLKEKILAPPPPRGGMNGLSHGAIIEARLHPETEAMMVRVLDHLDAVHVDLRAAVLANNEAHSDMKTSLAVLSKERSGG